MAVEVTKNTPLQKVLNQEKANSIRESDSSDVASDDVSAGDTQIPMPPPRTKRAASINAAAAGKATNVKSPTSQSNNDSSSSGGGGGAVLGKQPEDKWLYQPPKYRSKHTAASAEENPAGDNNTVNSVHSWMKSGLNDSRNVLKQQNSLKFCLEHISHRRRPSTWKMRFSESSPALHLLMQSHQKLAATSGSSQLKTKPSRGMSFTSGDELRRRAVTDGQATMPNNLSSNAASLDVIDIEVMQTSKAVANYDVDDSIMSAVMETSTMQRSMSRPVLSTTGQEDHLSAMDFVDNAAAVASTTYNNSETDLMTTANSEGQNLMDTSTSFSHSHINSVKPALSTEGLSGMAKAVSSLLTTSSRFNKASTETIDSMSDVHKIAQMQEQALKAHVLQSTILSRSRQASQTSLNNCGTGDGTNPGSTSSINKSPHGSQKTIFDDIVLYNKVSKVGWV